MQLKKQNLTIMTVLQSMNVGSVYATVTGKRYHTADCSYISRSQAERLNKAEAGKKGLSPCNRCCKEELGILKHECAKKTAGGGIMVFGSKTATAAATLEEKLQSMKRPIFIDPDASTKDALLVKMALLDLAFPTLLPRRMRSCSQNSNLSHSNQLRFLQFNALAQGLSDREEAGFLQCPEQALDWDNFRKFRLLQEVLRHGPDVVALQELDHFDDFFQPALAHFGYEGVFQPKPHATTLKPDIPGSDTNFSDGAAIFWKTDILQRAKIEGQPAGENAKSMLYETGNQVAIMVRLQRRRQSSVSQTRSTIVRPSTSTQEAKTMLVVSTHLKSSNSAKNEAMRTSQVHELLANVQAVRHRCGAGSLDGDRETVVIMGDFNTEPSGETSDGHVLTAYAAIRDHPLQLKSAYATKGSDSRGTQQEAPYTTCKIRQRDGEVKCSTRTIDYIWVSDDTNVEALLEIPKLAQLPEAKLPALEYPSDHLSIACDLIL
jgi:mRNA deadenylase 3'-5' endonuclease subunit Ccr4